MSKRDKINLKSSYVKYRKTKAKKSSILQFLRKFMPEIIFRTTKLEGESVTRRKIASILK